MSKNQVAVVAGCGPGLGAAISRQLLASGYRVVGLSRSSACAADLAREVNGSEQMFTPLQCDITDADALSRAVAGASGELGDIAVYVHNAAKLLLQPFLETTPDEFEGLWRVICLGAVSGAQAALPLMLRQGSGTLLFIGATASVRGGAQSAAFSSAKFALRGLTQSLARAYGPAGIHIAHVVVDGVIWGQAAQTRLGMRKAQCLTPEAVAQSCLHLIEQDRSAWSQEIDLRPNVESF